MVFGAFGPWVVALGQSVSGIDGSNDGWVVLAAAGIGGLVALVGRRSRAAGLGPLLAGIGGGFVAIHDRSNVSNAIKSGGAFAQALAHVGWGLNLAMIASISLAIAGLGWLLTWSSTAGAGKPAVASPPEVTGG